MPGSLHRLPALQILVDGNSLSEPFARAFVSLRVEQSLSSSAVCELGFQNVPDAEVATLFAPGAALTVTIRDDGTLLFEGRVSSVETGYGNDRAISVAVRAYDALMGLRNRQSARAFVQLNAADLARELVGDLGMSVHCDEPGPAWPRLLQTGTDFDLLADVTDRCGLYFTHEEGGLHLQTLEGRGSPIGLTLGDDLYEVRFEVNAHGASRSVGALSWDPWRGLDHGAQADRARSARGAQRQPSAADIGGSEQRSVRGRPSQGEEQALAMAQGELDARHAQALVLWGTGAGNARLRPGRRIDIAGVAAGLSGPHVLTRLQHTLDVEHGFVTHLCTALPVAAAREGGAMMTLGEVTRIDDPDRIGRVQVALPAWGNVESDWLQVVTAGAGQGKGLVAQPDVGDRVLLLLDRADPAQAVVLGSLYADMGLPEEQGGLGRDASFCFITPGGHRLRMDDGKKSLHLAASAGSSLEMTPDRVTLHAAAPLTIDAPGQRLVIRAKFIDFDRN